MSTTAAQNDFLNIPPEWQRLMHVADRIQFGHAQVVFQNGKPVHIHFTVKDIKLTNNDDFKQGINMIPLL